MKSSPTTILLLILFSLSPIQALASPVSLPPMNAKTADHLPLAHKAMEYLDASPDPFHAVQTSVNLLEKVGFEEIDETRPFFLEKGGKYYFTRNKSTLVVFAIGTKYVAGEGGFKIIGGHTDSPNLKVKPRSKRTSVGGCKQIGVECYGGGK
jgi:aspartyl aminopeptidase